MNRIIRHQDAGGPLGLFRNGDYLGPVTTSGDPWGGKAQNVAARQLGVPVGEVEVLSTCAAHPRVAAVDCLVCVPGGDGASMPASHPDETRGAVAKSWKQEWNSHRLVTQAVVRHVAPWRVMYLYGMSGVADTFHWSERSARRACRDYGGNHVERRRGLRGWDLPPAELAKLRRSPRAGRDGPAPG